MSVPENAHRLDETNIQLGKELWLIHSSLAVYRVIGLNASAIPRAKGFFGFVQNQSLSAVALGLGKVFERELPAGYELCSVGGVFRLAQVVQIQNSAAAEAFAKRYRVTPTTDWDHDVGEVFSRQRPRISEHMAAIDRVRNTRLAHIQQMAPEATLPSIAAFEELLAFGRFSTCTRIRHWPTSRLKAIGCRCSRWSAWPTRGHSLRTSNFAMNPPPASLCSAVAGYRER